MPEIEFLSQVLAQAPGFVTVFLGREHRYAFMNNGMAAMLRGRNVIGHTLAEIVSPVMQAEIAARLDQVWNTGKPIMVRALPYHIYNKVNNDFSVRYGDFLHQPIKNKYGQIMGVYVQGVDVTDRKLAQENLAFLKQQSIGLVRDIIAMIKSSVEQVLETSQDLNKAYNEVQLRFDQLVKVQMAFMNNNNTINRSLHNIVRNAVSVMMPNAQAIEISGQAIELNLNYQSPVALLVQEMARHAISQDIKPEKIKISWKKHDDNILSIVWQERAVDVENYHFPSLDSDVVNRFIKLNQHNKVKLTAGSHSIEYVIDLYLEDA